VGHIKWKIFIQHTILATLPSTYQNSLKLVEICRSSDGNKNAQFLRHGVEAISKACNIITVINKGLRGVRGASKLESNLRKIGWNVSRKRE